MTTLAAAQSASVAGDIPTNLATHIRLTEAAADAGADLVLFPELSLSGYEPDYAAACALSPEDAILAPLQRISDACGVVVIAGAPLKSDTDKPYIGAVVFAPRQAPTAYCKRYLHTGEDRFASIGTKDAHTFDLPHHRVGLAICADTATPQHPHDAAHAGATLYAASVMWSKKGYATDAAQIAGYAAQYGFGILLANHGGPSGGYETGGQSAFWTPDGRQIVVAPDTGEGLLLATDADGTWSGRFLT